MNKKLAHGSDLDIISKTYNISKDHIINFAGNVNPLGLSPMAQHFLKENLDCITQYPDPNYTELKNTLSNYTSIEPHNILVGNGSTELISLTIKHLQSKKALILGPTYSEYKKELNLLSCELDEYSLNYLNDFKLNITDFCKSLANGYDFLIICNPNNPTGKALYHKELKQILEYTSSNNIFVMIDETYIEFSDNMKQITGISLCRQYHNLLVVRGFSKFFSAPGLRLGYAITSNDEIKNSILKFQNPWSVNSIAEISAQYMLNDLNYIKDTKLLIASERNRISLALDKLSSIEYYKTEANFFLVNITKSNKSSNEVFKLCLQEGFLIRDCKSFFCNNQEFIRFCIMDAEYNTKLLNILKQL